MLHERYQITINRRSELESRRYQEIKTRHFHIYAFSQLEPTSFIYAIYIVAHEFNSLTFNWETYQQFPHDMFGSWVTVAQFHTCQKLL